MPTIAPEKQGKLEKLEPKSKTRFRQTMTFTLPQTTYLRETSTSLGISVSDLVRRIIDEYRSK